MTTAAIVGPGRLGTLLAVGLARAGHRVVAVAGGGDRSRGRIGDLVAGVRSVADAADAARLAELTLLSVPDDAVERVVTELAASGAVGEGDRVVHLAGALGLEPLRRVALTGASVAACHPAMTVPAGASDPDLLVGTAWAVTTSEADRGWAHRLVADLGGDPYDVPDDRRALYHAGLAMGSNAVGAALATARRLLLAARIDDPRAFLDPLVRASASNVLAHGAEALTGPVVRGDIGTIAGHLAALDRDVPELASAYRTLALATLGVARPGMDAAVAARLERLLSATGED